MTIARDRRTIGRMGDLPSPDRFRSLRALVSKAGALLMLVAVSAATGLLVVTNPPETLPGYGEESLGRLASATVRFARDYDIPDPRTTERNRDAAVGDVRPVYDFDAQLQAEVGSRVAESFAFARAELLAHPSPRGAAKGKPSVPLDWLRGELIGRLQTSLDPKDFLALVDDGFSARTEQVLTELVQRELSQLIVEDRALLPVDKTRGILVRPLAEGLGESVSELEALRDLSAARVEVERLAEAGNESLRPSLRHAVAHVARGALRPNLFYDAGETARRRTRAREDVTPVVLHLARGELLLSAGERIEPRHLLILNAIRAQGRPSDSARLRIAVALLGGLLCFLCYRLARTSLARRPGRRDTLFMALTVLATLGLTQGVLAFVGLLQSGGLSLPGALGVWSEGGLTPALAQALPYAMPLSAGTILVRLFLGAEPVALYAVGTACLLGLLREGSLPFTLYVLAACLVAGRRARNVTSPRSLLRVGAFVASTNVGMILLLSLFAGRLFDGQTALELGCGLVGGMVVTPLVVAALAPLSEATFGYISDARLAELCSLNHPALKDLIVRAPGTYHHSIVLAGLAERGAEAIGANALLARAIGLYHDLGKGKAPLMFSENQKGRTDLPSGEDLLEALRKHVADGVEVGRRYKLPRALLEAIAQHHGTRRVGGGPDPAEGRTEVRYDGPRPRRRETAIVMLADAVEAQGRRLTSRDLPNLGAVVREIVSQMAAEGQLDESDLRLGDLAPLGEALTSGLAQAIGARGQEPAPPPERPTLQRSITLELN